MSETQTNHLKVTPSSVDDLRTICQSDSSTMFAILDACDEPRVPEKVRELGPDLAVSLYRGAAARDYAGVAPYLMIIDETTLDWIVENLWEDPWGIFAVSKSSLEEMRKHFRQFLIVEGPDGEKLYFRFYDPRVTPSFLQSSVRSECETFYGKVERYLCCELGDDDLNHPIAYEFLSSTPHAVRARHV